MTAMLITLTFILPPDAGEKVGLSKFIDAFLTHRAAVVAVREVHTSGNEQH